MARESAHAKGRRYPTEDELCTAVQSYRSWTELREKALTRRPTDVQPPDPQPVPEGQYATIVADPPWRYGNTSTRGAGRVQGRQRGVLRPKQFGFDRNRPTYPHPPVRPPGRPAPPGPGVDVHLPCPHPLVRPPHRPPPRDPRHPPTQGGRMTFASTPDNRADRARDDLAEARRRRADILELVKAQRLGAHALAIADWQLRMAEHAYRDLGLDPDDDEPEPAA